jgi:hypothetical protein
VIRPRIGWGKIVDHVLNEARLFLALPFTVRLTQFQDQLAKSHSHHFAPPTTESIEKNKDASPLWEARPLVVNKDLHPAVASALGVSTLGNLPTYWRLHAKARDVLNKRGSELIAPEGDALENVNTPSGYGLVLKLPKPAIERLGADAPALGFVPIRIVAADFYLSQTRLGQIVFELSCGIENPSAALVVEILHKLAHGPFDEKPVSATQWSDGIGRIDARSRVISQIIKHKSDASKNKTVYTPVEQISIFQLAKELVCGIGDETCAVATPRAFSYVLASTAKDLTEAQRHECAARLARRLNLSYTPADAMEGLEFASPFEKITHACSQEGGAALVSDCDSVQFLSEFCANVGESVYQKLALLAHKEFCNLVDLTQGSSIYIEHDERDNDKIVSQKMEKMIELRERLLNFRLAHRFSVASYSANHNLVHAAWRRAMQTGSMLDDVAGDIREADVYLSARHADLTERKADAAHELLNKRTSWLQALLGFFAGLEGTRVGVEILAKSLKWATPENEAAEQLARTFGKELAGGSFHPDYVPWVEGLGPILVGVAVAAITWHYARKGAGKIGH